MDVQKAQKSLVEIASALYEHITSSDQVVVLRHNQLGRKFEKSVARSGSDGTTSESVRIFLNPMVMFDLRHATQEEGKSPWYSCVITVDANKNVQTDFDYEGPPDFEVLPVLEEDIVTDLSEWPRANENIQPWLRGWMNQFGVANPPRR